MVEERDDDIIARLSSLPEARALDYFWLMIRGGSDHLALMRQMTRVTIARPADWDPAKIRRAHERQGSKANVTLDRRQCFGCGVSDRRLYFHHLVEVYHGGSNAARNQVALCFDCHRSLHPWLQDEHGESRRGFESLRQIASRAL